MPFRYDSVMIHCQSSLVCTVTLMTFQTYLVWNELSVKNRLLNQGLLVGPKKLSRSQVPMPMNTL